MPKVSIIVPVYNVEDYLEECLESIISQSLQEIEIICVNDASQDRSGLILSKYEKLDPRLRIITHESNMGLGPARNTGVDQAIAPYISFVDSDDYISVDFLKDLYESIISNDSDMSWCGYNHVSEKGIILGTDSPPEQNWTIPEVLDSQQLYPSILPVWNKLFRRNIIGNIKQLPIISEDQPALAEYFSCISKISTVSKPQYFYRKRSNTLTNPTKYNSEKWEHFFYSHKLFFEILSPKIQDPSMLKKQVVLRHYSLLWRINSFNLLNRSDWNEHRAILLINLREDGMGLRDQCRKLYRYLIFFHSAPLPKSFKQLLLKTGMRLSREKWLDQSSWLTFISVLYKTSKTHIKMHIVRVLFAAEHKMYRRLAIGFHLFYRRDIWLVGERRDTAQENGFFFFKYLKENHTSVKSFYVIDKRSKHYQKVKDLGAIVNYNSLTHKVLFYASRYYVTAHYNRCYPTSRINHRYLPFPDASKHVFIPHGVTYADVSHYYGKSNSDINLFICGAEPEFRYILDRFGYKSSEVRYTGLSRFDDYHNVKTNRQIVVMPTWRRNIYKSPDKKIGEVEFAESEYYKEFQSLLNSTKLHNLLSRYDYELVFYPHYEIQHYINQFSTVSDKMTIASRHLYTVQNLLKDSTLLITDTSSVQFDFAYMYKPMIYYFFDKAVFEKTHFRPGYFNHKDMGFGELINSPDDLIQQIESYLLDGCTMKEPYLTRARKFFPLHDTSNCQRIYQAIIE